ncbi:GDYXXLXY domain-containing protein [Myroides phaeus]|uniref:Uncharacterized membrane-anchored protein n=1 Tax=Myroides phaeus TaxID=702745 RepID=A0A1G8D1M7_9FLAO|nr:GDYXXLXY domain-containing protein [Myroides phaeus]SDH51070.1 Uncharacterized membrane-anchored protein [Myroides phaeus]
MKQSKTTIIIIATLVVVLLLFVKAVMNKENTIKEGKFVLLELAPVDPRSLMQGDYMELNYAITREGRSWQAVQVATEAFFANDSIGNNSIALDEAIALQEKKIKESKEIGVRGYVLLDIDANQVGHYIKMTDQIGEIKEGQVYIKFFNNTDWSYNIGAESFFFQEGEAEKYEKAKYGGLRVDDKGNSILIGMYDESLQLIK